MMNHGTCEVHISLTKLGTVTRPCGKAAKYGCTSPLDNDKKLVCGIHKRWYASHGWVITDLEREAKMKEESGG